MHPLLLPALWTALASAPGLPAHGAPPRCADPWIDRAVVQAAGRPPRGTGDHGECDLRLYGARWGSFEQLREQVRAALRALDEAGLAFTDDGRGLRDLRAGAPAALVYLGPAEGAPGGVEGIALPRGYRLVARRPPPAVSGGTAPVPAHPATTDR